MHIGIIARHDVREVETWAKKQGMSLVRTVGRLVRVEADTDTVERVFGVVWEKIDFGWHTLSNPKKPECIQHVVGLSTKGKAHHMHVNMPTTEVGGFPPIVNNGVGAPGYTPEEILEAYQANVAWNGSGEILGICEWGNDFAQVDVDQFCSLLGIPAIQPMVINVGGYVPSGGPGAEADLDVEWAHGIAPGASIVVYQGSAGNNGFSSWALEVTEMLNFIASQGHIPTVLSISYGNAESSFTVDDVKAWDLAIEDLGNKGCTVVVSSGDQGAYGNHEPEYPQFAEACAPASCPHALGIGGTSLYMNGMVKEAEYAWSNWFNIGAGGGGISKVFAEPSYQFGNVGRRQVPDLAACADPGTPAFVVINGNLGGIGGTSWAAPVVAGLLARVNHARRLAGFRSLGFINPVIYDLQKKGVDICTDIVVGNNSCFSVSGYDAQKGYDWVTGWGSPNLTQWLDQLAWGAPNP